MKRTLFGLVSAAIMNLSAYSMPIQKYEDWKPTNNQIQVTVGERTFKEEEYTAELRFESEKLFPKVWLTQPLDNKPLTVAESLQADETATIIYVSKKISEKSLEEEITSLGEIAKNRLLINSSLSLIEQLLKKETEVLVAELGAKSEITKAVIDTAKNLDKLEELTKDFSSYKDRIKEMISKVPVQKTDSQQTAEITGKTIIDEVISVINDGIYKDLQESINCLTTAKNLKVKGIKTYEQAKDFWDNYKRGILLSNYTLELWRGLTDDYSADFQAKWVANALMKGIGLDNLLNGINENLSPSYEKARKQAQDRIAPFKETFKEIESPFEEDHLLYINWDKPSLESLLMKRFDLKPYKILAVAKMDSTNKMFSMDSDCKNTEILSEEVNDFFPPSWSPDGKRIAFEVYEHKNWPFGSCVYIIDKDGTKKTKLIEGLAISNGLFWSPDGKKLFLTAETEEERSVHNIFSLDIEKRELTKIVENEGINKVYLSLSPDGQKVAFSGRDGTGEGNLYVMNIDGTGLRTLIEFNQESYDNFSGGFNSLSEWSPDGKKIFFVSRRRNKDRPWEYDAQGGKTSVSQYDICSIKLDGTGLVNLTKTEEYNEVDFSVSPDGKMMVFRSEKEENNRLYVLNLDKNETKKISESEIYTPKWSPDGKKIFFMQGEFKNLKKICSINPDGTEFKEIKLKTEDVSLRPYIIWSPRIEFSIFKGSEKLNLE